MRKKIRESEVHDLKGANEEASHFLLSTNNDYSCILKSEQPTIVNYQNLLLLIAN